MSGKERSGLFKIFYIFYSIIMSPIWVLLFLVRHIVLLIVLLLMILGGMIYVPLQEGVAMEDIFSWYKIRLQKATVEVVSEAVSKGKDSVVPKSLLKEMEAVKEGLVEEIEDAETVKSDNYNRKVSKNNVEQNDIKNQLKQRRGFKRKLGKLSDTLKEEDVVEAVLSVGEEEDKKDTQGVGGLSDVIKKQQMKAEEAKKKALEEAKQKELEEARQRELEEAKKKEEMEFDLGFGTEEQDVTVKEEKKVEPVLEEPVLEVKLPEPEKSNKPAQNNDELDEFSLF